MPEVNKKPAIAEEIHSDQVAENQDAQLAAEAIEEGVETVPDVKVEADYEASKQFSTNPHSGQNANQ